MMRDIGTRLRRGMIFGATLCVFVPGGLIVLGVLAALLGATTLAEMAFRFYYIYAFVPGSFLNYPDVSPKLGIPATAFGIASVVLYWLVIAVIIGLIHTVVHGREKKERTSGSRLSETRGGFPQPQP